MATRLQPDDTLARLGGAVSAQAIVTDPAECDFYAQDVHSLGPRPLAVFRPGDMAELARGLSAIAGHGVAIVPRGGGMSYTRGYVADAPGALIVDLGRMDRILSIDETDMVVTVEAGCTWATLYQALKPRGLRTPLWGTLSGIKATVGGGVTQNGVFWGGGSGSIAPSALSFDVVLADGRIVTTGNGFLRPFGPDITGLFAADAGALGIKAQVTLPLVRDGTAFAYGSYAFDTVEQITSAMSEVARAGLATESFGFDPFLQAQRMKRDSLAGDAKALVGMMKSQGGFWKALKEGAKVVAAGRSFLDGATFSAHIICEGRSDAAVADDIARVNAIVSAAGGRAVENTIPKILRSNPFPPVNSMVGPDGERWVPVHGIVRHSQAVETVDRITDLYDRHAEQMERLGVGAGYMFVTVGVTGFLIEPVFYFPDALAEMHRRSVEPAHLARLKGFDRNDDARALVDTLRQGVIDIFTALDGIHFQIGRTYPYRIDPVARDILTAAKRVVDDDGVMNPGALGLQGA
jgi:FAD/FMN-containing dehydrogenase